MRDELKAANGYEGEDGAFKLNIENNLKKQQQMVVMESWNKGNFPMLQAISSLSVQNISLNKFKNYFLVLFV